MQLQLDILPTLNWLDLCFKALLSSCSIMCSLWQLLSAVESPVKSKLTTTTFCLKLHLYYKINGDSSEISTTIERQSFATLDQVQWLHHWWWYVSLAQAQIVHVLIVLQ